MNRIKNLDINAQNFRRLTLISAIKSHIFNTFIRYLLSKEETPTKSQYRSLAINMSSKKQKLLKRHTLTGASIIKFNVIILYTYIYTLRRTMLMTFVLF